MYNLKISSSSRVILCVIMKNLIFIYDMVSPDNNHLTFGCVITYRESSRSRSDGNFTVEYLNDCQLAVVMYRIKDVTLLTQL